MRPVVRVLFVGFGLLGLSMLTVRSFPPGLFQGAKQEPPAAPRPVAVTPPKRSVFVKKAAWQVRCPQSAEASHCQVERTIRAPNREDPLLRIMVSRATGQTGPRALFVVPPDVHRPAGVSFKPGDGLAQRIDYFSCSKQHCIAALPMSDALVEQLKTGQRLDVRFVMGNRRPVDVGVDLKGFAAAYGNLQSSTRSGTH